MEEFENGAKRSQKLPRYELLDLTFLQETVEVLTSGAETYGECNWQKGGQDFVQEIPRHMFEHILALMAGDESENHLAHIACNVMFLAKLRKKYPYKVAGQPEQLGLYQEAYDLCGPVGGDLWGEINIEKMHPLCPQCLLPMEGHDVISVVSTMPGYTISIHYDCVPAWEKDRKGEVCPK